MKSPIMQQHQYIDAMDEDYDLAIDGFNPLSTWQTRLSEQGIMPPVSRFNDSRFSEHPVHSTAPASTRDLTDFGAFLNGSFQVGWGIHGRLCIPTCNRSISIQSSLEHPTKDDIEREFLVAQLKLHYSHSFPVEEQTPEGSTPRLKLQCSRSMDHLQQLTTQYKRICQKYVECSDADSSSIVSTRTVESDVWDLVNVLFSLVPAEQDSHLDDDDSDISDEGNLMSLADMQRRAALSTWLKQKTHANVTKQVDSIEGDPSKEYEKILTLLSGNDLAGAVLAASASGNVRLSTLISTAGTMTDAVNSINEQQRIWKEEGFSKHIDNVLSEIYELLGGNVDPAMHIVSNDWKRALGLHLWYGTPRTASISAAMESYLMAVEEGKAPFPSPWHSAVASKLAPAPTDTAFELIKMFCLTEEWETDDEKKASASESLPGLLSPLGTTPRVQHASFYWHLFCVLESIDIIKGDLTKDASSAVARTITTYINELESIGGLAHWAVYVALHIEDNMLRDTVVKDLLSIYAEEWQEDDQVVAFFVEKLGMPVQFLEEAKSTFAAAQNDYETLLESQMDAKDWNDAHSTLQRVIAPRWFLAKEPSGEKYALHDTLIGALEEIEQHKSHINAESWRIGGGMYLLFFRLKDRLTHTDQITETDIADLEELQTALDDAYTGAQDTKNGYMEKAAYAIIAREISSIGGPLSLISGGFAALRYSGIQSKVQSIAHALVCDSSL